MKTLSREEVLSILGLGEDPNHSLSWYKNNYSDLQNIIQKQISTELDREGIYPLEAKQLNVQERCIKYLWLIIKKGVSDIRVLENDTDRGLILAEHAFTYIPDAIELFINKSYCAGGAISNYL